jgi:hypothetical protein
MINNTNDDQIQLIQPILTSPRSLTKNRIIYSHFKKCVLDHTHNFDYIIRTFHFLKSNKTLFAVAIDYYKIITKSRRDLVRKNSEPSPTKYRSRTLSKRNLSVTVAKREETGLEGNGAQGDNTQINRLIDFVIEVIRYNLRNNICFKPDIIELIINMNNTGESKENITKITDVITGTPYEKTLAGVCGLFKYVSPTISRKNSSNINQLSSSLSKESSVSSDSPAESILTINLTYKDIKPIIFATELTLICSKYFLELTSFHFMDYVLNETPTINPINPLIDLFEKISNLVIYEIVYAESESSQVFAVGYFIKVAREFYRMKNYHMLFSILSGLNNIQVSKIGYLWKNKPYLNSFAKLDNIILFSGNFQNYRNEIASATGTIIPYVGLILSDLIHLAECKIFDYALESINENILQTIYKCCCVIDSKCRNCQYELPSNSDVNSYILNLPNTNILDDTKPPLICDSKKRSRSFEQKPSKPMTIWVRKNMSSIELSTPRK